MTTQNSFNEKIKKKAKTYGIWHNEWAFEDLPKEILLISIDDVFKCYAEEEKEHQHELRIMQASIDHWTQLARDRATKLKELLKA